MQLPLGFFNTATPINWPEMDPFFGPSGQLGSEQVLSHGYSYLGLSVFPLCYGLANNIFNEVGSSNQSCTPAELHGTFNTANNFYAFGSR